MKLIFLIPILLFVLITAHAHDAHATPGHGEPIILNLGDRQVGIDTHLSPLDLTLGDFTDATMSIQFYDAETGETFDNVTYFVEIWRADELLARELFFDFDGNLEVKIKPDNNCQDPQQFKCTKYYGAREPITGGLYDLAGTPVVQGPVMTEGGIYTLEVEIVGASGMTTQLTDPVRIQAQFSALQEQQFVIQNEGNDFPIVLKSYYDSVKNFRFDEAQKSMSFEMPFDWQPSAIEHTDLVHQEIRIPKYFEAYADDTSFQGYVDGIELSEKSVILDPYSYEEYNIIHMIVTNSDLRYINEKIGQEHHDQQTINFELFPKGLLYGNSIMIGFDTGAKADVSILRQDTNQTTPIKITFFDENGQLLKNVRYGYEVATENGEIIITDTGLDTLGKFGIFAPDGIDVQDVSLPDDEVLWIKLVLFGHAINSPTEPVYNNGIGQGVITIANDNPRLSALSDLVEIPPWVKTNAGWWADGSIDDNSFIQGIQYLIKEEIMKIPASAQDSAAGSTEIPPWVKTNAGWWADGSIDYNSFIQGIQYLIKEGLVTIPATTGN